VDKTFEALDALIATFLTQHSATIASAAGEVVVAAIGLLVAWIAVRRTKIKTAADGAVDTIEALTLPRASIYGEEKKAKAQDIVAEVTGIAAKKLGDEVQAAWERRRAMQDKKQNSVRPPV
jgi:hypothetical protein